MFLSFVHGLEGGNQAVDERLHQELAVVVLMEGSNHCAGDCPGYTDPLLPVVVTKGQVAEK